MKKKLRHILLLITGILTLLSIAVPLVATTLLYGSCRTALLFVPALLLSILFVVQLFFVFRRRYPLNRLRTDMSSAETPVLEQLTVPVVLVQENGDVFWYNTQFAEQILHHGTKTSLQAYAHRPVHTLFSDFSVFSNKRKEGLL